MALFESDKTRERRHRRAVKKHLARSDKVIRDFKKAEEEQTRIALEARKSGDVVIFNKAKQGLKMARIQRIHAERARMNMKQLELQGKQVELVSQLGQCIGSFAKLVGVQLKGAKGIDRTVDKLAEASDRANEASEALFDGLEELSEGSSEMAGDIDGSLVSDEEIDAMLTEQAAHEEEKSLAETSDAEIASLIADIGKEREKA